MIVSFLKVGAVFGTLLFGAFRLMAEYYHTDVDKQETKLNYHNLWKRLDDSKLKNLPEKVVYYFFTLTKKPYKFFSSIDESNLVRWFRTTRLSNIISLTTIGFIVAYILKIFLSIVENNTLLIIYLIYVLALFLVFMFALIRIMEFLFDHDKNERISSEERWNKKKGARWATLVFVISTLITGLAISFGDENLPSSVEEFIGRIYITNFIFDLFTIYVTVYFLSKILKTQNLLLQIVFVLLDILWAAFFAVLTLFVIKFTSTLDISVNEIFWNLIGRSEDGSKWEIGRWFWLMHTTFIPTFIFLFVLLIVIICKLIVIPLAKFFAKASIHSKPHYLTACVFGVLGTVCGLLLTIIKF